MARPIPVLPLVGSITVAPGLSTPRRSASSSMASAMRSFTLPPGLSDSTLASTTAPPGLQTRFSRTSDVPPIRSSTDAASLGLPAADLRCVMGSNPIGKRATTAKKIASDVIHRARGTAPILRAPLEIFERGAVDDAGHRLGDFPPELEQVAGGLSVAGPASAPMPLGGGIPLHRAQHGAHRELVRRPAQSVAAGRTAPRVQEAGPLELQQHLLEIALRDALARCDLLDGLQPVAFVQRQVQDRPDRVLAFGRNPHARPCSISRAMSLAKYVMMMSAPARRIPVSASTMARSSSSQPSWPAARIMAYSPDTE